MLPARGAARRGGRCAGNGGRADLAASVEALRPVVASSHAIGKPALAAWIVT
ncbi:MAG: hypothetical protein U1E23_06370 [Reyranellaceae bacterium]